MAAYGSIRTAAAAAADDRRARGGGFETHRRRALVRGRGGGETRRRERWGRWGVQLKQTCGSRVDCLDLGPLQTPLTIRKFLSPPLCHSPLSAPTHTGITAICLEWTPDFGSNCGSSILQPAPSPPPISTHHREQGPKAQPPPPCSIWCPQRIISGFRD
jgi:hypothetical protein